MNHATPYPLPIGPMIRILSLCAGLLLLMGCVSTMPVAQAPSDQSQLIREVQTMLVLKGFDPGPADGVAGRKMYAALAQFQRSRGLPTTSGITQEAYHQLAKDRGGSRTASLQGQDVTTQIGPLKDTSPFGCGCYFSPVVPGKKGFSDKYLFISDDAGKAYINIGGRDTALQEVGRKQTKDEGGYCAGKRCTYRASGVKATVDFKETKKCPPEPTECEVTDYEVTITVEKSGSTESVKGRGSCGC